MKISLNLLKTLIDCDWSYDKIAERLTMSGTEVEGIEKKGENISGIISARVLSAEKIAGSEKLSVCQIDFGKGQAQVVCGAPNVAAGQSALFAPVGAGLLGGVTIENAVIHETESAGMILSEAELGLSDEDAGIAVLPSQVMPGTPLDQIVNYKDIIFELEITPNRPDCLSHLGIARELQALGGGCLRMPDVSLNEIDQQASEVVRIAIDDSVGCPRYTGRVIRNVKIGPSPLWLKMLVYYLGMRPINNVVDITNYVMMELGQPLHAFDFDLFNRPQVLVRRAASGEKFITLDNVERKLGAEHLLITDSVEGVAIAGIMGGLKSEVTEKTRNILLESAYFDPVVIRRGSKSLGLASESSRRFERGADPNMAPMANNRSCKLISDLAGGVNLRGIVDTYPSPFTPIQLQLRPSRVEHLIGAKIRSDEIIKILGGLNIKASDGDAIAAEQPSFRPDLTREVDLIEEIARVYGFDNIPADFRPGGELTTPETKIQRVREKVRSYMAGAGATEIFPITLADSRMTEKLGLGETAIRLMNPLSEEMAVVRPNLILTMLPVVRRNLNFRESNLTLFEIGDVYRRNLSGVQPGQRIHLALALTGMEIPDFWGAHWRNRDLFSLKGLIEDLAEYLGLGAVSLKPANHYAFDKDYSFEVFVGDKMVGAMGQLSSAAADIADIKDPVLLAELDFEDLVGLVPDVIVARELARFPSADRDIAIIVDEDVMAEEIRMEIIKTGGNLVDKTWIFDLYRGKNIPAGRKSLAFGIKYRLPDRTLTDDEVKEAHERIISALQKRFSALLRK